MAMIKCPECGKEISDKAINCPGCGYPVNRQQDKEEHINAEKVTTPSSHNTDVIFTLNNQPVNMTQLWNKNKDKNKCIKEIRETYHADLKVAEKMIDDFMQKADIKSEKKKQSVLSIVSAVLTVLCITFPIAFITALIDLIRNDKTKKHTGSWFAIIMCVLFMVIGLSNSSNDTDGNANNNVSTIADSIESMSEAQSKASNETNNSENADVVETLTVENATEEPSSESTEMENSFNLAENIIGETEKVDVSQIAEQQDPLVEALKKDFNEKFAKEIAEIFRDKIGFANIEYTGKIGDTANYSLVADGIDIMMTAWEDDGYIRIFTPYGGGVYYDDGEVLLTAEEKLSTVISWSDRITLYIMAQDIVKNNLKSPKSADFPSIYSGEISMLKKDGIVGVQSYVDATNSFGAVVRTGWVVEFRPVDMSTYTYEVIYIKIGDQTAGTFVDLSL